jgi:uncharacterized protein with HEPN domain
LEESGEKLQAATAPALERAGEAAKKAGDKLQEKADQASN